MLIVHILELMSPHRLYETQQPPYVGTQVYSGAQTSQLLLVENGKGVKLSRYFAVKTPQIRPYDHFIRF